MTKTMSLDSKLTDETIHHPSSFHPMKIPMNRFPSPIDTMIVKLEHEEVDPILVSDDGTDGVHFANVTLRLFVVAVLVLLLCKTLSTPQETVPMQSLR
jgi:hypothetical protein